jgi:hypothetical protein
VWLAVLAQILAWSDIRLYYTNRAQCSLPRGSRTITHISRLVR